MFVRAKKSYETAKVVKSCFQNFQTILKRVNIFLNSNIHKKKEKRKEIFFPNF